MGDYYGHAVVDGELRYASVSSVKMFDRRTKGGCPRRWAYRYVFGKSEEESEKSKVAKEKGIKLDEELKHYLLTGEKTLSALALKGLGIVEKPGPDLRVNLKLHTVHVPADPTDAYRKLGLVYNEPKPQPIIESALTAGGVPFIGEIDYAHERGHYIDDNCEVQPDPPGTVEVCDIKFKSNAKDRQGNSTLIHEHDLVRDIQMAGYGEWVGRVRPNTSFVRLSHLYFIERGGPPTKVTRLHVLEDCHRTWEYVDGVVRNMREVARETDVEKVPYEVASCDAYGGCPHRGYCTAAERTSLDSLYNKIAGDWNTPRDPNVSAPQLGAQPVGILANNPQIMNQAPAQPDMRAQLAAEEAQMRAQVAQQQQQMPQAQAQPSLADILTTCHKLNSFGFGFPTLVGNAAQAYFAAGGQSVAPGTVQPGIPAPAGAMRSLHSVQLAEVAHIFQLCGELEQERAKQAPPMVVQATQAPSQNPATTVYVSPQPVMAPQGSYVGGILPPGAPQSMPQLAAAPTTPTEAAMQATTGAEAPRGTRGRPKKAQDPAPEATAAGAVPAASPPSSAGVPATQVPPAAIPATSVPVAAGSGVILINARFEGRNTKSLVGYVDYINEKLAKMYNTTSDGRQGPLDVRAAVEGSILGYGGWKGIVREIVVADPPPADDYHLDTHMDDLLEAVADGLRRVAEAKGWQYIRGVRS